MSALAIPHSRRQKGSAKATTARIAAVVAACLLVSFLVVQETRAAFVATTDNAGNTFDTGTVVLTDDDAGSALFTVTDMVPGQTVEGCIDVQYTGSIFTVTPVHFYGSSSGPLAAELDVVVQVGDAGSGGAFNDCTGFATSSGDVYNGKLNAMPGAFGSGATWTPALGDASRVMRIAVTLPGAVGNAAQGQSASATFTWEVQSA